MKQLNLRIILAVQLVVIQLSFGNLAFATPESEWKEWVSSMSNELKNSEESFLNVTDTVYLSEGDKIYLALGQRAGQVKWSKTSESKGIAVEFKQSLMLTLEDKRKIDLNMEQKWKLSDGRLVRAGKLTDGRHKLYIHDPISPAQLDFTGLNFYPYDSKAVVIGTLEKHPSPVIVKLKTSGGESRAYNEIGYVDFKYNGHQGRMKVFSPDSKAPLKLLLLFFRDATSAKTTYGGGRNIEIELSSPQQKEINIDFNRAFNPYCARSTHFQCVLSSEPPLPFAVEAGEQKPTPQTK